LDNIRFAARPLSSIPAKSLQATAGALTGVVDAVLEGAGELGTDANRETLAILLLLDSLGETAVDVALESLGFLREDDVAKPLAIDVDPLVRVR